MKTMTKLFALGGLAAIGTGAVAAARAKQREGVRRQQADAFDFTDLDEPMIVTEEIVVVSEAGPYEIEMELIPADQPQGSAQTEPAAPDVPGRGAAPR
jgi:hypothetical protein